MSWMKDLFTGSLDKIVDSVGNAIDKTFTSDHERLKMHNELEQIRLNAQIEAAKLEQEAEAKMEEAVTKRWEADTNSDDKLAKQVRPLSLIYLLFFMSVIIVTDSASLVTFEVKDVYIELVQSLLLLVFGAYYGGRSVEKIMRKK